MDRAIGRRRWNSDRYPKAITVRVTAEEHAEVLSRSERARLSASRFLVRCALARRAPPLRDTREPTPEERRDLEFLLYELRKLGVNLNQLARHANRARLRGSAGPPRWRVEHAAAMAEGLMRLVRSRL